MYSTCWPYFSYICPYLVYQFHHYVGVNLIIFINYLLFLLIMDITIEMGYFPLTGGTKGKPDLEWIQEQKQIAAQHDVTLHFMIYDGITSTNSGGRPILGQERFLDILPFCNSNEMPVIMAPNGGLLRPEVTELDAKEHSHLDELAKSAQTHKLKNKVIVTYPSIADQVRKEYPGLELIASCIQQVETRFPETYQQKFEKYDYVVPLNQDINFETLSPLKQYADKMIIFLTLPCQSSDRDTCRKHYMILETQATAEDQREAAEKVLQSHYADSELENCNCLNSNALFKYPKKLLPLMGLGVNKFKYQRMDFPDAQSLQCLYMGAEMLKEYGADALLGLAKQ